ncbi:MAG: hypothetical protein OXK77_08685 [Gemmatimonadota bacterium]|nr:hypothetical protein [Gemmatimonadota bacterium]
MLFLVLLVALLGCGIVDGGRDIGGRWILACGGDYCVRDARPGWLRIDTGTEGRLSGADDYERPFTGWYAHPSVTIEYMDDWARLGQPLEGPVRVLLDLTVNDELDIMTGCVEVGHYPPSCPDSINAIPPYWRVGPT